MNFLEQFTSHQATSSHDSNTSLAVQAALKPNSGGATSFDSPPFATLPATFMLPAHPGQS
jgi:hypothetical protein